MINYSFFRDYAVKIKIKQEVESFISSMNKNEISLSITNISDDTTTTTHHYIPKDLFSCLICYETFGVDQQELVALKCGHMFCASCIHQWFTTNKGFL